LLCNYNQKCDYCLESKGSCVTFENYLSCPSDCKPYEEDRLCIFATDGVCDPDCVYDEDCADHGAVINNANSTDSRSSEKERRFWYWLILGIAIVVLLIILVMNLIKKSQGKQKYIPKKDYNQVMKEAGFRK
jgi:hypothetical protein